MLVAEVRDTGIGIPADQLDSIFESFRPGESGLARAYPGLGLGLALAQKLAKVMGGQILVESQPGVGSTFTLEVPLRRAAGGRKPVGPRQPTSVPPCSPSKTIRSASPCCATSCSGA